MNALSVSDVIFYSVLTFFATSTIYSVGTNPHSPAIYQRMRSLRPRHILANLPVMAATIVAAGLLIQIPGLDWGWGRLIGLEGNIVLGQRSADAAGTSAIAQLVPFVMIGVVLAALPVLVYYEERAFRLGSEYDSFTQRLTRALTFGMFHLFAGIPIAAALALTIPGLWFTARYLQAYAGVDRDAPSDLDPIKQYFHDEDCRDAGIQGAFLAHAAWNYTLVVTVLAFMLINR